MLDLTVDSRVRQRATARARDRGIRIPTLREQMHPELVPEPIRERLRQVRLWDVDPANLYRITWRNHPTEAGGLFGSVNAMEFPSALTGVEARIIALVGNWFPTGAHKVGAAFGCLAPRLVTGQFDPTAQTAVWPSTGNFCRGGAYDSALLGCQSIAILPEGMSEERFAWLATIAGRVIRTPGTESNVKEIFDACWELRHTDATAVIFNQFEAEGNYLWHYWVTGTAMADVLERAMDPTGTYRGLVVTTGSAGTIASGDYLKRHFPYSKIAAGEALQCPTMLMNGYGDHRIEGIGDKHIPWIHNVRNTDLVIAIDDEAALALIRLFNEPAGRAYLASRSVPATCIDDLRQVGISGAANLLACIKFAKWYDLGPDDIVLTVLTDSIDLYHSRLRELTATRGPLTGAGAMAIYDGAILGTTTADMIELTEPVRRRIHNLKYFTWVEQQGKSCEALDAQWASASQWTGIAAQREELDGAIDEFNGQAGTGAL